MIAPILGKKVLFFDFFLFIWYDWSRMTNSYIRRLNNFFHTGLKNLTKTALDIFDRAYSGRKNPFFNFLLFISYDWSRMETSYIRRIYEIFIRGSNVLFFLIQLICNDCSSIETSYMRKIYEVSIPGAKVLFLKSFFLLDLSWKEKISYFAIIFHFVKKYRTYAGFSLLLHNNKPDNDGKNGM